MIAEKSWEVSVEMSTEDDDTYDTHTARMDRADALPDGRYRVATMCGGFVQDDRGGEISYTRSRIQHSPAIVG